MSSLERHYSLVVERQPCKLKVPGSIPGGGFFFEVKDVLLEEKKVLPRGLEPRTLRLLAVRSDQLSYKSGSA